MKFTGLDDVQDLVHCLRGFVSISVANQYSSISDPLVRVLDDSLLCRGTGVT